MHHRLSRNTTSERRTRARWAARALLVGLVVSLLGPAGQPADGLGYSPVVDEPAPYDGQTTCTTGPRPGTRELANWLLYTYPVTRSMGMMRSCSSGSHSEHKDGRAFDWGADVARASTRQAAYAFIKRALATDSAGNEHAMARRMGIMYMIYDDTIWSSYRDFAPRPYLHSSCRSKATCSRTLRHLDHVHISLGLAGAAAQTSWYRSRNVPSQPVFHPGTHDLDADQTAVTGFKVPATGEIAGSYFYLRPGVTYRVVITGAVRYGSGRLGDANCTWPAGSASYTPTPRGTLTDPNPAEPGDDWGDGGWGDWGDSEGSDHLQSLYAATRPASHGVILGGALRWEATTCRSDHTYEAWYTPATKRRLQLRYVDDAPADNTGSFTVYVARDDITRSSLAR